jgi:hypothetical protein
MNAPTRTQSRSSAWPKLIAAALLASQLVFAVAGPFSSTFSAAWSIDTTRQL